MSLKIKEKTVSNDAKMPSEVMSETGSLALLEGRRVSGNFGENRFRWGMGKETELEAWLQALMGRAEVRAGEDEGKEGAAGACRRGSDDLLAVSMPHGRVSPIRGWSLCLHPLIWAWAL